MLVPISVASEIIGVCPKTLRRWDEKGWLVPFRTEGNHRRYDMDALCEYVSGRKYIPKVHCATGKAAIYCRVSSHGQKEDLVRQREFLVQKAGEDGYEARVYMDIGSGLNDSRKNFLKLIVDSMKGKFDAVYLTYLDRLARFGTKPLRKIFEIQGISLEVVHSNPCKAPEKSLVDDMIALVTSFSGKIHRMRRGKNAIEKA